MESRIGEHMLYFTNHDKPGVIGDIGSTAARHSINIANLHLGRAEEGGQAIALLEIDEKPSDEGLQQLRSLPNITNVEYLNFPLLV